MWPTEIVDLAYSTSPEVIEATQRRDVRAARRKLGKQATVAEISEECCLPVFNVLRALDQWEPPVVVKKNNKSGWADPRKRAMQ